MTEADKKWSDENIKEDIDPDWIKGEFEAQIICSTDGKNTVMATAKDSQGREAAFKYVIKVYDYLRQKYGTKQGQAVKEYSKENDNGKKCPECGASMTELKNKDGEILGMKCSKNKWNKLKKKAEGCPYVEWYENN